MMSHGVGESEFKEHGEMQFYLCMGMLLVAALRLSWKSCFAFCFSRNYTERIFSHNTLAAVIIAATASIIVSFGALSGYTSSIDPIIWVMIIRCDLLFPSAKLNTERRRRKLLRFQLNEILLCVHLLNIHSEAHQGEGRILKVNSKCFLDTKRLDCCRCVEILLGT
jgi:hypothetical protein